MTSEQRLKIKVIQAELSLSLTNTSHGYQWFIGVREKQINHFQRQKRQPVKNFFEHPATFRIKFKKKHQITTFQRLIFMELDTQEIIK